MYIIVAGVMFCGCNPDASHKDVDARDAPKTKAPQNAPTIKAANKETELSCKLSTPELRKRKETVLKSLRQQVLERKELANGFAFRFPGSDHVIDEITEFIKTERSCCDFFTFSLSVSGDKSEAWLELTGVDGAKDFISNELEL